ncbi:hypothetical protein Bca52824_095749 [Brassica carinata]|uniref:Uncharacterized protein n=1 Tax=Brassica carinata TaxID=52824 RepID=A0A8X7P1Y0_BRACI|nr:hypothetical protein Bca52824_095749 [Brassica carinata]
MSGGCHKPVIPVDTSLSFNRCATPAKLPPDNVLRSSTSGEGVLGLKKGCYPPPIPRIGLESSSTGSSFPADSAKPVPLAVVSLDSRQGQWESR